eukprot:CAMPEP_0171307268 /NCGR_PEP_ID=MMETSP0816-20121228/17280_1 /TAXON_ID=420281 /ORGANISM="Proboscia inermis, Strain CCAP1064/1" /LENGTH=420 /DNA_ID=CAMNT_0011789325 /DNA_START=212 /DNA_END=1474 /DNA_ORIENTATION=+
MIRSVVLLLLGLWSHSDAFTSLSWGTSTHRAASPSPSPSPTSLDMAKKPKKKPKKSGSSTGVKGFGTGTSSSSSTIDRSKQTMSFYEYVESFGPVASSNLKRVALGYFPLYPGSSTQIRGVVALNSIAKGEVILGIPYEMALNLGKESSDPTLPAYTLLQEICKDNNSREPYIQMLPEFNGSDCLGSTDFFGDAALEALQHPMIQEETLERRSNTAARFERDVEPLLSGLSDGKLFTLPDGTPATERVLAWAVWLITSRVLTVQGPIPERGSPVGYRLMIPLLDMCNHDRKSPHVLTGRAEPGGLLKIIAGRDVEVGEQINICYGGGVAGNDRFIQDYGFLDDVEEAYDITAKQLKGMLPVMEGNGGSAYDRVETIEALEDTTVEEDEVELAALGEQTGVEDVKSAIAFRIGLKKALARL